MNTKQRFQKRLFDIVLSLVGLIFLWPVILSCIVIARLDTKASGLFSHERIGRGGKYFCIRKIRTMREVDRPQSSITTLSDERITTLGHWLRRLKLDELPQLWNVLVGEMSFVGPRPDVPGYADGLGGSSRKILELRPGITGPATIKNRNENILLEGVKDPKHWNDTVLYPDKVKLNLQYLNDWSLKMDLRYILMTLKILSPPPELTALLQQDRQRG